jgi:hypothetical protein
VSDKCIAKCLATLGDEYRAVRKDGPIGRGFRTAARRRGRRQPDSLVSIRSATSLAPGRATVNPFAKEPRVVGGGSPGEFAMGHRRRPGTTRQNRIVPGPRRFSTQDIVGRLVRYTEAVMCHAVNPILFLRISEAAPITLTH